MKLRIAEGFSLPIEFVTSTQAVLAQKGKGKTYLASVEAEELLDAEQQIVVIDPTDAWWGLRSSPDGRSTGYPIAVFGGDHGDLALEPTAGEVLANAIVAERFSAVIVTEQMRKGEEQRFVAAFLETLYRKNRNAMHLFIDEADLFAPQKPFGEEARTCGATEDVVRRGRKKGIGCTLITQRAAVLNKNVLSQADTLVALGMSHPKDLDAVGDWVKTHADPKKAATMLESLPSLPRGEAWFWAPARDIFKRVAIRERRTFDSGKTPEAGQKRVDAKVLAPVDIARLGKSMAETVERVKRDDPKTLRGRIAQLERELASKRAPKTETKRVDVPVLKAPHAKLLADIVRRDVEIRTGIAALHESVNRNAAAVDKLARELDAIVRPAGDRAPAPAATLPQMVAQRRAANDAHPAPRAAAYARSRSSSDAGLPTGEALTLAALIQYERGLRREQLGVLTGYKRSTRDAYIQRLREKGFCELEGDRVRVTPAGVAALPDAEPLPSGQALQDWWMARLPEGERAVLRVLVEAFPQAVAREAIDDATGFKRSTRDAYLQRLAARELVDVSRGAATASEHLFGGGV